MLVREKKRAVKINRDIFLKTLNRIMIFFYVMFTYTWWIQKTTYYVSTYLFLRKYIMQCENARGIGSRINQSTSYK